MQIYAKSRLDKNIYDKVNKHADGIELHLDEDFVNNTEYWDEKIINEVNIVGVHMPLLDDEDSDIDVISNRQLLHRVAEFTQKIANIQGHSVIIICHLGTDPVVLKNLGIYDDLVLFVKNLVNEFPNIELAVENVSALRNAPNDIRAFRQILYNSAVEFAKDVAHERVGTCLDTCHAMMEIKSRELMSEYFDGTFSREWNLTMRDFFAVNQPVIKWIHLSHEKKHGYGKYHGMPFLEKDKKDLEAIMSLYEEYDYMCPITLEVQEEDYSNAVNFEATRETLLDVLGE